MEMLLPLFFRVHLRLRKLMVLQILYTSQLAVSPYKVPPLTIETTIVQTPSQTGKSGGVSGGAAAGIVISILILAAIGGGAFFYVRRRQRTEYQKQYEGSSFGSSPGSLNRPFGVDQRLEPGMVQKRESVGSLADEQDYSRKILRVAPNSRLVVDLGD
jgi:cell wall integrity and stress response component